jgi:WD40 repeat protein
MIYVRDDLMRTIDKKINLSSPIERLRWERIKQHLFVGLRNGELHRVDWENEKSIEVFKGPAAVSSLAVRRDGTGLFVGFKNGTVMLFADSLQTPLLQLNALHNGPVLSAHWSYEGDLLATVGKDKSIKVWRFNRDKKKLEVEATLDAQGGTPLQVRFSSNDELMAVGFAQGKLGIWSRKHNRWKVHQTSHGTSLLAWNNQEKDILLTAAHRDDSLSQTDRNIHMWNAGKSEDLRHLWAMNGGDKHHKQPITSLTVNWNDQAMASSSMDGGFGIWKLRRAYGIMSASYASSPVSLATRNDGAQVIAGTSSSMVHMYNVANAQEPSLRMMKGHNQSVGHILLNQEGSRLFSAGLDGALLMWDMNSYTPTMMSTFPAPSSSFKPEKLVTGMALSPDQKTVVMASWTRKYAAESDGWKRAGVLTFWSLSNNSKPQQVLTEIPLVYTVAHHPTKDIMITGHTGNRTYIWHKQNGTWSIKQELLNQHPLGTTIVSFSGDGQLVATSGRLGDIRVWEWETGKTIQRFDTGGAAPSRLLFHPNKSVLAASLGNGKVKIWDLSTGNLSRLLTDPDLAAKGITEQAHDGSVNSMAWSGDGTTLYTSGSDLKIKQWKCPEPQ